MTLNDLLQQLLELKEEKPELMSLPLVIWEDEWEYTVKRIRLRRSYYESSVDLEVER